MAAACQKPDGPDQNETAVPLSFSVSAEDAVAAKAGAGSEVMEYIQRQKMKMKERTYSFRHLPWK